MRGQPQREAGRRQEQRSRFVLPSEKNLEQVRREQLEYARQQAAAERRSEAEPAGRSEQKKDKEVPALFGPVGRKTG
jgi:hypothetical protein